VYEEDIEINGRRYHITGITTPYRTASARMKGSIITVRIPSLYGRDRSFEVFKDLKQRMIKKISRRRYLPEKQKLVFSDGQILNILGRPFVISVSKTTEGKTSGARMYGEMVKITLASGMDEQKEAEHTSSLARRAISSALMPHIRAIVEDINKRSFNSELGDVRLKDNMSNWGSCSRRNNINLDFRLLFAPRDVMDAVIMHELAHTKHRNHSSAFYTTLTDIMPDYKERMQWLKLNADKLIPGQEL
jgi:predicted metal-dependent hydrolase